MECWLVAAPLRALGVYPASAIYYFASYVHAAGPEMNARPRLGVGELEGQVIDVLWDDGGHLTAAAVKARLAADRELAITTVTTVLVRLLGKGVVTRERRGRAWAYRPVLGREEQTARRMNALLRGGGDESIALSRFVENMTPLERARLRALLDGRDRTQ